MHAVSWRRVKWPRSFVDPKRPFVSLLSRLASGLVFCCLVSTCIFLPWLLCSCVLLCRMLGLPWAFLGPLPGLCWDPFWASGGPFWSPWGLAQAWGTWALNPPMPSWRLLGPPLGRLGRLLAAESEFSRNLVKTMVLAWFRASWRPLGGSWVALGPS